jgi:phospholipid N-methyltransferase
MVTLQREKTYQAFYTKSTPIVNYMLRKLAVRPEDKIFEPCGGDGVFIKAILDSHPFVQIDAYEMDPQAAGFLASKFSSFPNVNIKEGDTLLDNDLLLNARFGGIYDKIIANPPYGAWQDHEKRAILKNIYPDLYTKETYTLFLYRGIELLKDEGILTFIIPDTFLNLHMHRAVRKYILTRTKIKELLLFPSSFFPGVSFGYANLSIITLEKCNDEEQCVSNTFKVFTNFKNVNQLLNIDENEIPVARYNQGDILRNPDHAFLFAGEKIIRTIKEIKLKIGDIADCVTGFYSGNDKEFLRVISPELKNGKNYNLVDFNEVNSNRLGTENILDGIAGNKCFIPIVKGGNVKFLKKDSWFMDWSKKAVAHYKTDKKARFQNSQFYFKYGIAVPMISSTSITASLIENKLFDQSIVGIFPKDKNFIFYLLAFFNSPTCNKLIRTINPSANNPANYIKKIPYIAPNRSEIEKTNSIVMTIIDSIKSTGNYKEELENELNTIFIKIYGF